MNAAPSTTGPRDRSYAPGEAIPTNRSMLYIEDDPDTLALLERLIRRRPHIKLHMAATARDGITAAVSEQPALILLDNRLPDATGAEVLRRLASAEATAGIPVVIVSGAGQEVANELLAIGAAGFLVKPYDLRQVMAIIDRFLP